MSSIRLHPEYGVNPTMGLCYICHNETGVIGLLGWNRGKEAPRRAILDTQACNTCVGHTKNGIMLVEAVPSSDGLPRTTGRYMVVTEEAARRILRNYETLVGDRRIAFVYPEVWRQLQPPEVSQ